MILICSVLLAATGVGVAAAEEPQDQADPPSSVASLTAEVWPFEMPGDVSPKVAFEQWRTRAPGAEPESVPLDGLSIPPRQQATMVRVSGVLTGLVTGDYAFFIQATGKHQNARTDETELWILDDASGEWKLAQTAGNPNKRSDRTRLEQGVPRRFELWIMGSAAVSVKWEVRDWDPVEQGPAIVLARQLVPATVRQKRGPKPNDRDGAGLRDSWKQRHGLALDRASGPDGRWGDLNGDGLLNWQEQLRDSNTQHARYFAHPFERPLERGSFE